MASRTIENDRDRKMTVMTTCFVPVRCENAHHRPVCRRVVRRQRSGGYQCILHRCGSYRYQRRYVEEDRAFAGEPAPFVMELPAYHVPSARNVLHATWERGWSFIKRAGTVILASSVILWFLQGFGFVDGAFTMVEDNNNSLLAVVGSAVASIFAPLGFGDWQSTVATSPA